MKKLPKILLRFLLGFFIFLVIAVLGFIIWRYTPVRINVTYVEKVVQQERDMFDRDSCARFKMTAAEFEQYFARTHRLFDAEANDYGAGACYYKTKIGNREYSIWIGGLAEISEGNDTDYYADSARKLPATPENP